MRFVLVLEVLTMLLFFGLIALGLNQAILGHWGFAVMAVIIVLSITLSGFAPIPGRFGEIPVFLVLIRKIIWKLSSNRFKELYFLRFVMHCVVGDYRKFIFGVLDHHRISEETLHKILMDYYQGRMNLIHPHWLDIAQQTFITYGEVDRVQVSRVQHKFDKLSPDGMIYQFKHSLEENNLNLIIENFLFYRFLNKQ